MHRAISRKRAVASGLFVVAILAVAALAVSVVATRQWRMQPTFLARAEFATIGGINLGDRVRVQGMDAGVVERIEPPTAPGGMVTLWFRIDDRLRPLVRSDARAQIASQGVVGAKVIEIRPGRADAEALAESGRLGSDATPELSDLVRDASNSLKRVDAVATAAERGLTEVNAIASSIREGKGSLGRLVQDEEAYRKLLALSDRGTRALSDLEENLAALKRTWPLSRYFDDRAFYDREHVLFKPGADRESKVLNPDTIFEPGRSVLTPGGRVLLDEVAAWFKRTTKAKSKTEIVIAAFSDDKHDPDLTQMLTQEQADSVRSYLVGRHGIDSVGWFGTRKVAAIGFGIQVPRAMADAVGAAPPGRRVEVILFTPRT